MINPTIKTLLAILTLFPVCLFAGPENEASAPPNPERLWSITKFPNYHAVIVAADSRNAGFVGRDGAFVVERTQLSFDDNKFIDEWLRGIADRSGEAMENRAKLAADALALRIYKERGIDLMDRETRLWKRMEQVYNDWINAKDNRSEAPDRILLLANIAWREHQDELAMKKAEKAKLDELATRKAKEDAARKAGMKAREEHYAKQLREQQRYAPNIYGYYPPLGAGWTDEQLRNPYRPSAGYSPPVAQPRQSDADRIADAIQNAAIMQMEQQNRVERELRRMRDDADNAAAMKMMRDTNKKYGFE